MAKTSEVIGLIPAAGFARRIAPLPCSKEVYPIMQPDGTLKVASSYLMESLRKAKSKKNYLVLREGKWDIPEFFKDGCAANINLAYIITESTEGVPQTIDKAYPYIKRDKVLFGFPDILFRPSSAFTLLLEKQHTTGAELVLGLFAATKPEKMDMVHLDGDGKLRSIIIKPAETQLTYTWIIAAWTPVFTEFLHDYVATYNNRDLTAKNASEDSSELYIGAVFRKAIETGLKTTYVTFEQGSYIDIGTPDELNKVHDIHWLRRFNSIV